MIEVWCEFGQCWLPARVRDRAVWWQGGPVATSVPVRLSGEHAGDLAHALGKWGYRRVEIKEDSHAG